MIQKIAVLRKIITLSTCFFILISCSDSDTTPPIDENPLKIPATGSYLRANVGADSFTSRVNGVENVEAIYGNEQILITATNNNNEVITISLENITTTGPITINSLSDSILIYTNLGSSYSTKGCTEASGIVDITAIDDAKVEGTFKLVETKSDNCDVSKAITDGAFRAVFSN